MSRDKTVEAIFTTADDALQGLLGLHACVNAAFVLVPKNQLLKGLPKGQFRLTHQWFRHYDRNGLVNAVQQYFEFVQCRTSLTTLVSIFEPATERFMERLHVLGKIGRPPGKYKGQLKWVFETVRGAPACSGSPATLARLPETCGDLDNARRLRNCIAHNNGKYNDTYGNGNHVINDGWVKVQMERDYQTYLRDRHMPIRLTNRRFEHFSRSHVELLHILHNTIQSKFFGHHQGYHYGKNRKEIEWHRIMSGEKSVQM